MTVQKLTDSQRIALTNIARLQYTADDVDGRTLRALRARGYVKGKHNLTLTAAAMKAGFGSTVTATATPTFTGNEVTITTAPAFVEGGSETQAGAAA